MGIAYDNQSGTATTSQSGGSFSHTGADGPGRMAVFVLGRSAGSGGWPPAPTTLTYDGVSMLPVRWNAAIAATSYRRLCGAVLPDYNPGTKTIAWTTSYANWYMAGYIFTFLNCSGYRDVVSEKTTNGGTSLNLTATLTLAEKLIGGVMGGAWSMTSGTTQRLDIGSFVVGETDALTAGAKNLTFGGASALAAAGGIVLSPMPGGNQAIWMMVERTKKFYEDLKAGLIPPQDLLRRRREVFI